jgi:hypothetical protein
LIFANRKLSRNGLGGNGELGFQTRHKANRFGWIPGREIALHSPAALLETGLRMCLPEKRRDGDPCRGVGPRQRADERISTSTTAVIFSRPAVAGNWRLRHPYYI